MIAATDKKSSLFYHRNATSTLTSTTMRSVRSVNQNGDRRKANTDPEVTICSVSEYIDRTGRDRYVAKDRASPIPGWLLQYISFSFILLEPRDYLPNESLWSLEIP